MPEDNKDITTLPSKDIEENEKVKKLFSDMLTDIYKVDSLIPADNLKKLKDIADPELRLSLLSQFFYITKIIDSKIYDQSLTKAVEKLASYIPELPFEKLLLTVQELAKVKGVNDLDIREFLLESKKAEMEKGKESPGTKIIIDNRSVEMHNPVIEKMESIPPEKLERILKLTDAIGEKLRKK